MKFKCCIAVHCLWTAILLLPAQANSFGQEQPSVVFLAENKRQKHTEISAVCESHPTSYLASAEKQIQLENSMRSQIAAHMAGQSWQNYRSLHLGKSISIGKAPDLIWMYFSQYGDEVYARRVWDEDSIIDFDVTDAANNDPYGKKQLKFDLSLNKKLSKIEGIPLWYLMSDVVGLKDYELSGCMTEFISSIEFTGNIEEWSGPTPPGRQSVVSKVADGLCNKYIKTEVCSYWYCAKQTFITLRPCN
jgi:hypothetical protein